MFDKVFEVMSSFSINDTFLILTSTVPFFVLYVVFAFIYFKYIDVRRKGNNVGLSRFCFAGIFTIFGIILFDLIMEFFSAFLCKIDLNTNNSILIESIGSLYKSVPVHVLINITIICMAVYTGTEGLIAGLKTLQLDKGMCVELPQIKRKRLSTLFVVWCYLSIVSTLYHFMLGSDEVDFNVYNFYLGLGIDLIILCIAERSPTMLQNQTKSNPEKISVIDLEKVVNTDNSKQEQKFPFPPNPPKPHGLPSKPHYKRSEYSNEAIDEKNDEIIDNQLNDIIETSSRQTVER